MLQSNIHAPSFAYGKRRAQIRKQGVLTYVSPKKEWGLGPVNQGRTHSHPKGTYGANHPWGWSPLRGWTL